MKLSDVINEQWLDAKSLSMQYSKAAPFPHIVMETLLKRMYLRGSHLNFLICQILKMQLFSTGTIKKSNSLVKVCKC